MIETDSKLSDLASIFAKYPQALVNVKVSSKPPLETLESVQKIDRADRKILGPCRRVLVRYSGTENICRVMVEGPKLKQAQQLADAIAAEVQNQIGMK